MQFKVLFEVHITTYNTECHNIIILRGMITAANGFVRSLVVFSKASGCALTQRVAQDIVRECTGGRQGPNLPFLRCWIRYTQRQ